MGKVKERRAGEVVKELGVGGGEERGGRREGIYSPSGTVLRF